ncbi:hypothetical protein BH11PSE9_BH11PSE9_13020 [soil metagenome]
MSCSPYPLPSAAPGRSPAAALWRSIAACALAAMAIGAQAQSATPPDAAGREALRARSLAATCAQCHGTAGRAIDGAAVPGLAGMPSAYLSAQMKAFASGVRPSSVMQQLAKGYSEAQIEQLAAYFAAQSPAAQSPAGITKK